jgi:hypothetical protein
LFGEQPGITRVFAGHQSSRAHFDLNHSRAGGSAEFFNGSAEIGKGMAACCLGLNANYRREKEQQWQRYWGRS